MQWRRLGTKRERAAAHHRELALLVVRHKGRRVRAELKLDPGRAGAANGRVVLGAVRDREGLAVAVHADVQARLPAVDPHLGIPALLRPARDLEVDAELRGALGAQREDVRWRRRRHEAGAADVAHARRRHVRRAEHQAAEPMGVRRGGRAGSAERKPEAPAARARLEDGIRDTPTAVELREAARPVAEEVDGHWRSLNPVRHTNHLVDGTVGAPRLRGKETCASHEAA